MFVLLPVSMFVLLPVSMLWSKEPVTVRRMHTFPVAGSNVDMLIKEHGYVSYVSLLVSFLRTRTRPEKKYPRFL